MKHTQPRDGLIAAPPDWTAELAVMRADIDDLATARRVALRRAGLLSAATVILLPILLAMWGPLVFVLTVGWVVGLATAWGRYIRHSSQSATRAMEFKALNSPHSIDERS